MDLPYLDTVDFPTYVAKLLLKVIIPFYTLISRIEELLLFHILAKTWSLDILILYQYDKFETEFHCGLICSSLITNGNKHFYMKAFVFSFYINCLFVVYAHFFY